MNHKIKIKGQYININLARLTYRCEVCLGKLRRQDFGLVCQDNPEHRGFIPRKKARQVKAQQEKNIANLDEFYTIQDGKVVIKELT